MGVGVIGPAAGGGVVKKVDTITSTGSWTAPNDCYSVDITLVGGGGGGNCASADYAGGGGGGGGYINRTISVTPGQTYSVTIGAGGAGGVTTGSMGGKTIFGSNLLVAYGGGPGYDDSFIGDKEQMGSMGGKGYGNGGNSFSGTGGGGAGSPSGGNPGSSDATQAGSGFGGNQGYGAYSTGNYHYRTTPGGGKGINGLAGGGGAGVQVSSNSIAYVNLGKDGGGYGVNNAINANDYRTNASPAASNGEANTGGGGGGGHSDRGTSSSANGGSGVAIIEYWTAA